MIILPLKSGPSNRELDFFCSKKINAKGKKINRVEHQNFWKLLEIKCREKNDTRMIAICNGDLSKLPALEDCYHLLVSPIDTTFHQQISLLKTYGTQYSRMNQVKFVEICKKLSQFLNTQPHILFISLSFHIHAKSEKEKDFQLMAYFNNETGPLLPTFQDMCKM